MQKTDSGSKGSKSRRVKDNKLFEDSLQAQAGRQLYRLRNSVGTSWEKDARIGECPVTFTPLPGSNSTRPFGNGI